MQLVERFLTAVTAFVGLVTFSPFAEDGRIRQKPLPIFTSEIAHHTSLDESATGPIFEPPDTIAGSGFKCDYSNMVGWEPCTASDNRQCWLKKKDGSEEPFDIWTDYENRTPNGQDLTYELDLRESWWSADGQNKTKAKLFASPRNASDPEYPGPWIQACWGDRVKVKVYNSLNTMGTSVHWHGVRQHNTMHMDGVNGVTQCPIAHNDYFEYKFTVKQYGSSWYHSHYSVQYADGAAGGLTFHGPSAGDYHKAINPPLIMTDWSENSAFDAVKPHGPGLVGYDILLNGLGDIKRYSHSREHETPVKPPFEITLEKQKLGTPSKKYLMRLINTSFQTTFIFTIDNHNLTVVSADFVPVFPFKTNSVLVGIGQRYDIIIDAYPENYIENDNAPDHDNFWIRTYVTKCFGEWNPGCTKKDDKGEDVGVMCEGYETTGILRYDATNKKNPTTDPWPEFQDANTEIPLPCKDTLTDLHPTFPWIVDEPPLELRPKNDLGFTDYPKGQQPYELAYWYMGAPSDHALRVNYTHPTFFELGRKGDWPSIWRVQTEEYSDDEGEKWIYLVIENPKDPQTKPISHPMHLHGHDFAVIQAGENKMFDPRNRNFNLVNPPRRDVILLPGNGFVVIAFKADNPGAWLVHCHIARHISEGLGMQIMENQAQAARLWPKGSTAQREAERVCKNWRKWEDKAKIERPEETYKCITDDGEDEEHCFLLDSGV